MGRRGGRDRGRGEKEDGGKKGGREREGNEGREPAPPLPFPSFSLLSSDMHCVFTKRKVEKKNPIDTPDLPLASLPDQN